MIVSCVQSIPYALIIDRSCSAAYTERYITEYLAKCTGDCCKGESKFGVQSPIEFIGDLKGDCDTRALLLFGVLRELDYRVALLTSDYYKHALIAVQLEENFADELVAFQIDGKPYYLWETTSKGHKAGKVPSSISNLKHWNIELIQK